MSVATRTRQTWLRAGPSRGLQDRRGVDRNKNVIYGASIATLGEAEGHGEMLDGRTLDMLVALGSQAERGVKARFTHPNESNDGLGSFLGRWRDFRRDGDQVRADLHFSRRAFNTPNGNLAGYVMGMAEDEPDMFGTSIVIPANETEEPDEKLGETLPKIRPTRLRAADVVDSPAANDELFSTVTPAGKGTMLLDSLFGGDSEDVIRGRVDNFLNTYFGHRPEEEVSMSEKTEKTAADPAVTAPAAEVQLSQVAYDTALATAREAGANEVTEKLTADMTAAVTKAREETFSSVFEVLARCELAKLSLPDARALAEKKMPIEEVKDELLGVLVKRNAVLGDDGGLDLDSKPDPAEKYRKEHKAAGGKKALGLSEDDFVTSALRDEAGGVVEDDE